MVLHHPAAKLTMDQKNKIGSCVKEGSVVGRKTFITPDWASNVGSVAGAGRKSSGASFPQENSFLTAVSARCDGEKRHCLVQHGLHLRGSGQHPWHGVARTLLGQSLLWSTMTLRCRDHYCVCVWFFNPKCFKCQRWLCQTPRLVPAWWACHLSPGTRRDAARLARTLLGLVLGGKSWIRWHLWPQCLSALFPHHLCSDFLWEGENWFTPEGMNCHTGAAEGSGNKLGREKR